VSCGAVDRRDRIPVIAAALVALASVGAQPEPAPAPTGDAGVDEPWGCPVRGIDTDEPALIDAGPPVWRAEALLALQPDQPREHRCNRGVDCLSATRAFVAGAVRGSYEVPDAWSAALTLSLGHHEDFEGIPIGGFGVFIARADFQIELGRARGRFGAAVRVSPLIVVGWSDTGTALRSDIPALALLLGERDLWGEVIVPSFPTHADPRRFYAGAGWRQPRFVVEGGLATFGSLGYQRDEIDRAANHFGLWAQGTWLVPDGAGAASPWELSLRTAIAYPFIAVLAVGYRFEAARADR